MATIQLTDQQRKVLHEVACTTAAPVLDTASKDKIKQLLDDYDMRKAAMGSKPGANMVLPGQVLGEAGPFLDYGHPPGVALGDKFKDRGQVMVAGVHGTTVRGIHAPNAGSEHFVRGAYSVLMSGVYVDDEDMGEAFWYTGEGGMDGKKQVKDQQMASGSNAALKNNCDTRTPVRVVRGFVQEAGGGEGGGGEGGRAAVPVPLLGGGEPVRCGTMCSVCGSGIC